MLADVIVIYHTYSTFISKTLRPSQALVLEAAIENKDFTALLECRTRLNERARRSPASTMIVASVSADIVMFAPGRKSD